MLSNHRNTPILKRNCKNWVFFTGAGCSAASGLPTFRGEGGIWNDIDAEAVASKGSWYCGRRSDCVERRKKVLDFFNPIRRMILELEPNKAHFLISQIQDYVNVTVITQNGDDFHQRAGSYNVIHLHGEALKNCSTAHPRIPICIDKDSPDIHIGDKAEDGSQIRPYVIFFGEELDKNIWKSAVNATKEADYFVVVGSSLKVYPAVDLLSKTKGGCRLIVIDKERVELPETLSGRTIRLIQSDASDGLAMLYNEIKEEYETKGCGWIYEYIQEIR